MKKNVLITGASGNLGKAAVDKFLKEDYNIIATVTLGKSLGYGDQVKTYEADLTNENAVATVIEKVIGEHSTLDAALLLVGGFAMGNIEKTDGASIKKMFALNFETAYYVARPVFQQMLKQSGGGRIVVVGSRPAFKPKDGKNTVAYSLSKSLIFRLAEILNAEGASKNVTASVIVPSIIDTPENRNAMPDSDFSKWVKPEDIADAMHYVCSSSGQALRETVLKVYNKS